MSFQASIVAEDTDDSAFRTAGDGSAEPWPLHRDPVPLPALADLVCASTEEMAERARTALAPVLPHQALVIVAPGSDGLPVRIAAPPELKERLAAIDWSKIAAAQSYDEGVRRVPVPDAIAGLRAAGWSASSAGVGVVLVVAFDQRPE